jgi:uncharacterized membrane protein
MKTEAKLEAYLALLDSYLAQIPLSDRADIIIEIKSHVFDAQAKKAQDIDEILTSMGDAESVAKRYLQERGLPMSAPIKTSSMMWLPASIKWLVLGFLGFIGIIVLVAALLIWRFTPFVSVDNINHRVSIGGGIIQVHDTGINDSPKNTAVQNNNEKK